MNYNLENLKNILDKEADLIVKNPADIVNLTKKDKYVEKNVIDNRFELVKNFVASVSNKDNEFYTKLFHTISIYINNLYDRNIDFFEVSITNLDELIDEKIDLGTIYFNSSDDFLLRKANRELSEKLFNFLCDILENNKDILLDIETLKILLNRNPELFSQMAGEYYISRAFNFNRLIKILNKNETLKKSNISVDKKYQLLIDTYQLDNDAAFTNLIKPEEYKDNHQKIDTFLMSCNAKTFIAVTRIIRVYYDKDIDLLKIIKQRNKNHFCERIIIGILGSYNTDEDISLVHKILTDKDIKIDYNYNYDDYIGNISLKSVIAISCDRTILKDFLNTETNIQKCYWYGESNIQIFMLYAITGDYEKALNTFIENYHYEYDYTEDFNDDFNKKGYTIGDFNYTDTLTLFIKRMVYSFKIDNIAYPKIKEYISKVLINEKVKYINLEEILSIISEILSNEDLEQLLKILLAKHNSDNLDFIVATENEDFDEKYTIRVIKNDEIEEIITKLNKKKQVILELKKDDKKFF